MFSPNDIGLQYPLQYKMCHGRHTVCDKDGRELFLIDVVRPSREARVWIEEWGKAICEKFNPIMEEANNLSNLKTDSLDGTRLRVPSDPTQGKIPIKRKRGRPRKHPKV